MVGVGVEEARKETLEERRRLARQGAMALDYLGRRRVLSQLDIACCVEGNTVTTSGVLWHNICLVFGEEVTGVETTLHIWHSRRLRSRANWIESMFLAYNVPGGRGRACQT